MTSQATPTTLLHFLFFLTNNGVELHSIDTKHFIALLHKTEGAKMVLRTIKQKRYIYNANQAADTSSTQKKRDQCSNEWHRISFTDLIIMSLCTAILIFNNEMCNTSPENLLTFTIYHVTASLQKHTVSELSLMKQIIISYELK